MSASVRPNKEGFKQSEVGVIPLDWDVRKVSQVVRSGPKNGYSGRSGLDAKGTATLSLSATTSGKLILTAETVKYLEAIIPQESDLFLKPDDVLVQRSNTIELVGTTAVFSGPENTYIYPDLMIRLRFRNRILAQWFWKYANSSAGRSYFMSVAAGSTGTMPKLSGDKLRNMPLPLPPTLAEQEDIVSALLDADGLIESLEKLIAKKRQIKHGTMQELLTGKRRLPGFSTKWETYRFDQMFSNLRNASNSRSELGPHGEVAYVHYGDIHIHPTAFLNPVALRTFIPRSKVRMAHRLMNGDLLLADASEDTMAIGKAVEIFGLSGAEAVAGLHTMALRGNPKYLADGFKGYIQFMPEVRNALISLATGVSVYGITKSGVRAIEVTIPKPSEQSAIAAILSDMDAEIVALESKLSKARQVKQGMMQELLTGRIRLV